jgi:hypothetical protein
LVEGVLVAGLLLILVLCLCPEQRATDQHPEVEVALLEGHLQEAQREEKAQRQGLTGRSTRKALEVVVFLTAETAETGALVLAVVMATVAEAAAAEQIKAEAAVVAVALTLRKQVLREQEELQLKAPQAPQANRLQAQQTFQPTQAGRCRS